jgi:RNA polymerase sigma-70 factor (ECF subfamily)
MQSAEDISLLERLRAGDQTALETMYSRYFSGLVGIAAHITGETIHAKDIVQNTFLRLWMKREALQVATGILPYLRKMVINEAIALQRKHDRRLSLRTKMPSSQEFHTEGEDALHAKETQAMIRAAIDALPERCSEIFKLSRYSELSYAEIAEALDLSIKTVENQMGKALKILRDEMKDLLK